MRAHIFGKIMCYIGLRLQFCCSISDLTVKFPET